MGQRIKELREKKGLTPTQLAAKARVTDGAILQLESGETREPRFTTGLRIARALDASPFFIAFGTQRGETEPDAERELLLEIVRRLDAIEKRIGAPIKHRKS